MMNKCLAMLVLGVMCVPEVRAVTAWDADNCEAKGGTRVTVSGTTFCKSQQTMNWWSSYTWCEAMGGHVPSMQELCPNVSLVPSGKCNRYYPDDVWSSVLASANSAYMWGVRDV